MIREYAIDGYSDLDDRLPSGICGTCRLTLSEYSKGVFNRPLMKYDHSTVAIRYETRSSQVEKICQCVVCEIARAESLRMVVIRKPREEDRRHQLRFQQRHKKQ